MVSLSLKIGELAKRTQCPTETIRYYEREGLLPEPRRTAANYRVYGREHIEQLQFIRNCRSLDMTLEEIRQLLGLRDFPTKSRGAAHAVLDEHIAHVDARLDDLKLLQAQLVALREQCGSTHEHENECGILRGLDHGAARRKSRKSDSAHVRGAHREMNDS